MKARYVSKALLFDDAGAGPILLFERWPIGLAHLGASRLRRLPYLKPSFEAQGGLELAEAEDFFEQCVRDRHLGHLESEVAPVPNESWLRS